MILALGQPDLRLVPVGARVLEGYPVDPSEGRKKASNELYRGVVSTFARAGFREVGRPRPDRALSALDLSR